MDLTFSDQHEAFRAEARGWLRANVPSGLASMNTAEGFAAHKAWERDAVRRPLGRRVVA